MIKPARLGSSVGMTLAHAPAERAARPRPGVRVRHAGRRRALSGRRARPRGRRDRQRAAARHLWARRDRGRPRVLRLRREVHARVCRRRRRAPTCPTSQRIAMQKLARDAYRSVGAEGFARVDFLVAADRIFLSEINTIPGFTPDQPVPDDAGRGGPRLHGRLPADHRSRHRTPRLAVGDPPLGSGPASMTRRPVKFHAAAARRPESAPGGARGLAPGRTFEVTRGAADARRGRVRRTRRDAGPGILGRWRLTPATGGGPPGAPRVGGQFLWPVDDVGVHARADGTADAPVDDRGRAGERRRHGLRDQPLRRSHGADRGPPQDAPGGRRRPRQG